MLCRHMLCQHMLCRIVSCSGLEITLQMRQRLLNTRAAFHDGFCRPIKFKWANLAQARHQHDMGRFACKPCAAPLPRARPIRARAMRPCPRNFA